MPNFLNSLKQWVDQHNFENGQTALHIASYYGKNDFLEIFHNLKILGIEADFRQRNQHGHTLIHMATLGDNPATIYYLMKKIGLELTVKDKNGSTPLHLAFNSPCDYYLDYDDDEPIFSSELSAIYLLTWVPREELFNLDDKGRSIMHLSIISSDLMNNAKLTRILMLRGAPRDIKDDEGNTPLDLAK